MHNVGWQTPLDRLLSKFTLQYKPQQWQHKRLQRMNCITVLLLLLLHSTPMQAYCSANHAAGMQIEQLNCMKKHNTKYHGQPLRARVLGSSPFLCRP
jgi:hypothetical protein